MRFHVAYVFIMTKYFVFSIWFQGHGNNYGWFNVQNPTQMKFSDKLLLFNLFFLLVSSFFLFLSLYLSQWAFQPSSDEHCCWTSEKIDAKIYLVYNGHTKKQNWFINLHVTHECRPWYINFWHSTNEKAKIRRKFKKIPHGSIERPWAKKKIHSDLNNKDVDTSQNHSLTNNKINMNLFHLFTFLV